MFLAREQTPFTAMQASKAFRQVFLRKLLLGLKLSLVSAQNKSLEERKKLIKLAADTAMAFAAGGAVWSSALITNISKLDKDKILVKNMLGKEFEKLTNPPHSSHQRPPCKKHGSTRVLKSYTRMRRNRNKGGQRVLARTVAKRLVKKRTQVLKCLIPGGEAMDKCCLLRETANYIVSLRAQVDVMRCVAKAFQFPSYQVSENQPCSNK